MSKDAKKKLNLPVIGVVACVCACFFSACTDSKEQETEVVLTQESDETEYAFVTAEFGEVVQSVKLSCTYTPTEHQDLAFGVEDKLIERVEVKKGDIVTEGTLLAAVDVGDLEETIDELEYQISRQTLELAHINELKDFDVTSARNLYSYTNKTWQDKQDLEEKLKDIDDTYHDTIQDLEDSINMNQKRLIKYQEEYTGGQLIAGMNGEVTYLASSLTDTYSEKDKKVITISNLDSCYFMVDDVTYADHFSEEESYRVVYNDNGAETYVEVTPVNREQWQEQMLFKPVNGDIFESDFSGTIFLELAKKTNVLCISNQAIHEAEDGKFVYVLEGDWVNMRYIETGLTGTQKTEIVSGLKQGEKVILK